jgi:hypothetical protein
VLVDAVGLGDAGDPPRRLISHHVGAQGVTVLE